MVLSKQLNLIGKNPLVEAFFLPFPDGREQQADIFAARSVTPPPQRAAGVSPVKVVDTHGCPSEVESRMFT